MHKHFDRYCFQIRLYSNDFKSLLSICLIINGDVYTRQGYEESLYKTKTAGYFLYGIGGEQSKYPIETITPITDDEAEEWIQSYCK